MNNMLTPHAMRCLAALVMLAASCGLLVRRREPRTRVYLINPPAVDHGKLAAAQCGQAPRAAATGTAAGPDCARMLACACDLAAARGMRRAPVAPAPCPKGAKLLILMRHVAGSGSVTCGWMTAVPQLARNVGSSVHTAPSLGLGMQRSSRDGRGRSGRG